MAREFGVLYFADSNPLFRRMLDHSIASLRTFHPDWPIEVVEVPSFEVPPLKRIYRGLSFWKWSKRRARANQDFRIVALKADIMLSTPFDHTLYLDADTVILGDLSRFLEKARRCDVLATQLPWKSYSGQFPSHPERFPYVMAGVAFYSKQFCEVYSGYVADLEVEVLDLPSADQYLFSMVCGLEQERLEVCFEPSFQVDVLNLAQHLGSDDPQIRDGLIDLDSSALRDFGIFHYNHHKDVYLGQLESGAAIGESSAP